MTRDNCRFASAVRPRVDIFHPICRGRWPGLRWQSALDKGMPVGADGSRHRDPPSSVDHSDLWGPMPSRPVLGVTPGSADHLVITSRSLCPPPPPPPPPPPTRPLPPPGAPSQGATEVRKVLCNWWRPGARRSEPCVLPHSYSIIIVLIPLPSCNTATLADKITVIGPPTVRVFTVSFTGDTRFCAPTCALSPSFSTSCNDKGS